MNNKEILANAPEGWTHVITELYDSPAYFKTIRNDFCNVAMWTGGNGEGAIRL